MSSDLLPLAFVFTEVSICKRYNIERGCSVGSVSAYGVALE